MTSDLQRKEEKNKIEKTSMRITKQIINENDKKLKTTEFSPPPEYSETNYSSINITSSIDKLTNAIKKNILIEKLSDEEKKNIALSILKNAMISPHAKLDLGELKLLIYSIVRKVAFLKINKPRPRFIKNKKIIYLIYKYFKQKKVNHLTNKYFKQIKIENIVSDLKISYTDTKPPAYKETEMPPPYTRTKQNPSLFKNFLKNIRTTRI